jgi:hypothetical protein
MPALPSVPGVLRVVVKGLLGEDLDIVGRQFIQYTGGTPSAADVTAIATEALAGWAAHMASQIMAGYATESATVTDLASPTGHEVTVTGSHAGGDSGVTNTAALSFIVQQKIARRYRGGHPRSYVAGVSPGHLQDDQTWDPTFAATTVGKWIDWWAAVEATSGLSVTLGGRVNVSYYEGFHNFTYPSGRTRPIATLRGTPVVDSIIADGYNPRPGSQRRRNLQGS